MKLDEISNVLEVIFVTKYSRMDQVKFVETAFKKFVGVWSA